MKPELLMPGADKDDRWPKMVLLLITLALFTDTFLYDMVAPFLPGIVKAHQASEAKIGMLFGAYAFALLAATPLMAYCAHRWSVRGPLLGGLLGLAASMILLGCSIDFGLLVGGRLLQGASSAAIWTAGLALLAEAVPGGQRGAVMGVALGGSSLGTLVGLPMGGILFDWGGYACPFVIGGIIASLLAVAFMLGLRLGRTRAPEPLRPLSLLSDRSYLVTAGVVVIGAGILTMLEPLLPLHLAERLKLEPHEIGLLFVPALLAYAFATPLAGWLADRAGRRWTMALGLFSTAACLPLLALPGTWVGEVCVLIPVGVGCALLLTPCLPELAEAVDRQKDGSYGLAYAFFNLAYAVGMLAGPFLGGIAASAVGFFWMLALFGVGALLWLPALISRSNPLASLAQGHSPRQAA
jgi:predicted MFS family arabinose efflux permease